MKPITIEFEDCYASFDGEVLTVGTSRVERRWKAGGGMPAALSLLDKTNETEWLEPGADHPACGLPFLDGACRRALRLEGGVDDDLGIAPKHLKAELLAEGADYDWKLELRVYPGKALVRQRLWVRASKNASAGKGAAGNPMNASSSSGTGSSRQDAGQPAALNADDNASAALSGDKSDILDGLTMSELHCRWKTVELRDVTDTNNNLIGYEEGLLYVNERRRLKGNLLLCRQTLRDRGLLAIKEGPTDFGRLQSSGGDFEFQGRRLLVTGGGVTEADLRGDDWIPAYGSAVGVCIGDDFSFFRLLDDYHRCIQHWDPDRDGLVLCNNWGDRSKDGRVSETFIAAELARASDIGVRDYQIDDGWQKGNTTNSVNPAGGRWSGYYEDGDGFWDVNPARFPNGLEPVAAEAERLGVRLALWFSPDSADDFANWSKDAARLLELHRLYGVRYFKLDGIKIKSKYGETNLVRMMETVVRETSGAVLFNLDATNEVRLGFYGRTQYGVLFLENRYTDFRSYYPHWTLRNLWRFAGYVPGRRLQMEVLNVERNRHVYGDDPLSPAVCGIGYAFAAVLFANPLVWMETTGLDEQSAGVLRTMLAVYAGHAGNILDGCVLPIGEEPDGTRWTGLQSVCAEGEGGYLIVFRERNPASSGIVRLWNVPEGAALKLECLMRMEERNRIVVPPEQERGEIAAPCPADRGDEFRFELASPFSFALYRYEWSRSGQ